MPANNQDNITLLSQDSFVSSESSDVESIQYEQIDEDIHSKNEGKTHNTKESDVTSPVEMREISSRFVVNVLSYSIDQLNRN